MDLDHDCPSTSSVTTQLMKIIFGSAVFFMQAGFSMLEAGSTGSTATTSILFKNLLDTFLGGVAWFLVGYAFAFGTSSTDFIGGTYFALNDLSACDYSNFFFQWSFATTAATIVSGSLAGRTKLFAYLAYSICITGWIYPVVVHWTWSEDAWLAKDGDRYRDFAGSGVVHIVGGTCGLVGSILVGPRGTANFENFRHKEEIPGHNMPLVSLGTLILLFGFIGFNAGSISELNSVADANMMALAAINTVLAGVSGGLGATFMNHYFSRQKYWSFTNMCNGSITGMVAICAGANKVYPWASILIGLIGGVVYKVGAGILHKYKVDDPVDASVVHLGGGAWGLVSVSLFAAKDSIFYDGGASHTWDMFGWQIAGLVTIACWCGVNSIVLFATLRAVNKLRVSDDEIDEGLDIVEHGESAYVFSTVARETNRPGGAAYWRSRGLSHLLHG